jgi:hypothetical protein
MHAGLPIHFVVSRIDPAFENLDRDTTDISIGPLSGAIDKSLEDSGSLCCSEIRQVLVVARRRAVFLHLTDGDRRLLLPKNKPIFALAPTRPLLRFTKRFQKRRACLSS